MADLDIAAIRAELAAALRADVDLDDATVYDHLAPSPSLPAIHVGIAAISYHPTYGDGWDLTLTLTLEVGRENHQQAQRTLDRWLSKPGPIVRLEKHETAVWTDLKVREALEAEPRSLGDPAAGEIASLAVDVLVDINT